MDKTITTEKRQFPRITATLPIRISPEFLGETVDLSETGAKIALDRPLLLSNAKVKIEFSPEESIDTEFKVIWNKHLVQNGKFTYGVCFIRLKEKDLSNLRFVLIKSTLDSILDKTSNSKERELISNYWNKELKEYMDKLAKTSVLLKQGFDKEAALKEVTIFNDRVVLKGDELELVLNNKIIMKRIKKAFRELCGPWVYKSKIVKHAFEKPRGYPGDYKLIEIIYDNKPLSQGIGYCHDSYFLNNAYTVAVRNRKDKMKEILADFIKQNNSTSINILNLACGSSREIKELMVNHKLLSNREIIFTLVDQDEEALNFSKGILCDSSKKVSFKFLQQNVLDYIKNKEKNHRILGNQDMIYSIGLADYLPDRVLKNLISFCFGLLESKGKLVIAHKDVSKHKPLQPDWWCDWTFYPRDEGYLLNLISKSGIRDFDIKVEREPSHIILFLTIDKI